MTIVVPSSTQFVPNGLTLPSNVVWRGGVGQQVDVIARFSSALQAPGFPGVDFDLNLIDDTNGALIVQRNSFWPETNVVFKTTITNFPLLRFELQGGGEPAGTHQGTVFGFQLEVDQAAVIFGDADRQLLTDIERKLDRTPYQPVVAHVGLSGNQQIGLQPGVRAVGWFLTTIPQGTSATSGLPTYYFGLGFVTPATPVGDQRSTRITFQHQVLDLPPATTSVKLTLPFGLVLDLTEFTIPLG